MTTITSGATTITPDIVTRYESSAEHATIVHPILGSEDVAVSVRPARPPSGTITAVFDDLADATQLCDLLRTAAVHEFADPDYPALDMEFVAVGSVRLDQDAETQVWIVATGYQQVTT